MSKRHRWVSKRRYRGVSMIYGVKQVVYLCIERIFSFNVVVIGSMNLGFGVCKIGLNVMSRLIIFLVCVWYEISSSITNINKVLEFFEITISLGTISKDCPCRRHPRHTIFGPLQLWEKIAAGRIHDGRVFRLERSLKCWREWTPLLLGWWFINRLGWWWRRGGRILDENATSSEYEGLYE